MPYTEVTDSDVEGWMNAIDNNIYLTTEYSDSAFGSGDDEDYVKFIWSGEGDEVFRLRANTAATGGGFFRVSGGYADDVPGEWDDVDVEIYGFASGSSYDFDDTDTVHYWYNGGSDWFWTVARNQTSNWALAFGWQDVDKYWDYTAGYQALSTAVHASGHDNSGSSGWRDDDEPSWCRIDAEDDDASLREQFGLAYSAATIGSLTQDNEWRVNPTTIVKKRDDGNQMVGEIDAWGIDFSTNRPDHLDSFSCGTNDYVYVNPRPGLRRRLFFRND